MSAPDWRGIRIGVTAAPDSYRYYLRRRRWLCLRGTLMRTAVLVLCLIVLVDIGLATDWQAARTILHFLEGAN